MKLKTSYFNEAILHKNITRFAPLWGIYLVFGVLITFFVDTFNYRYDPSEFASIVGYAIMAMAVINLGYAALCALLLFGDLHRTRMCYSLHAMPMRREGWFLTNVTSGLLFSLGPNLIVTLIMFFKCGPYFFAPLAWLLGTTLSFVCFFGIATFCMHITGKSAAAVGMYLLLNFFSMLLYSLTELYFGQFWPGVVISETPFETLVPVTQLTQMYLESNYDNLTHTLAPEWIGFDTGFLWAGVGILLLVLALLIYRKRDLESAGDFITLRPAAPVVLVIYTVSIGGVLWAMFNYNFFVLLVGLALGFFTGRMLLQRTVKVFTKKNFLGYGIVSACVLLSIGMAILDPLGITRWVPNAKDVQSVTIGSSSYSLLTRGDGSDFESPEDIELIRSIHQHALKDYVEQNDSIFEFDYSDTTVTVYIRYNLINGTFADRCYSLPIGSEGGKLIRQLHSKPEYLFSGYASDAQELIDITGQIQMRLPTNEWESEFLPIEQQEALIRALEQDWLTTELVQTWNFHQEDEQVAELEFYLNVGRDTRYVTITVYDSCTNTVTWLKANGYLD